MPHGIDAAGWVFGKRSLAEVVDLYPSAEGSWRDGSQRVERTL